MAVVISSAMLLSPVTGFAKRNPTNFPTFMPSLKMKTSQFRVRSMAEDEEKDQQLSDPQKSVKPKPKASTNFGDILAFSGPGPERINGRLAMIGFVTAIGVELVNGQDVFAQLQNGGIQWFIATSVLLSAASLIPLFRGVTAESESSGLFSPDAELWNGRFAMLGLVALAFTEYLKGGALV